MRFRTGVLAGAAALAVFASAAHALDVEVSEAPMNDLALTVSAINRAQSSIYLNIYDLTSPEIADALLAKIQAGVHTEIIEEGQPVGGLSAVSKGIQAQLVEAMRSASNDDHLYEMTSAASAVGTRKPTHKRRYHFDHAKYAVIDGQDLLVGSENYSPTGNPEPGSVGNRGWETLIHDASIAAEFRTIFDQDKDLSFSDVLDLTGSSGPSSYLDLAPLAVRGRALAGPLEDTAPVLQADQVTRITSPDSSENGLLALLNGAQTSIDVEQMTLDPAWGTPGSESPLLQALISAARRGVKVRVLMNDETVFDHASHPSKPKNRTTFSELNQLASNEGLPIEARIANLKAMGVDYIHNKGALVDGHLTLVSSINWDKNAVENNREAAVLIDGQQVNAHYSQLFESDWQVSANGASPLGPLSMLNHVPARAEALGFECPAQAHLVAQIGNLTISGPDDASFASLSGRRLELTLQQIRSPRGCILTESSAGRRAFLEIHRLPSSELSVSLEGFTSKGKVYSIRASVADAADLMAAFEAGVYDGSGPRRERLGDAVMEIEAK